MRVTDTMRVSKARDGMLHTYIRLTDGSEVAYAPMRVDGVVLVSVTRTHADGTDLALMTLPAGQWIVNEGFSDAEVSSVASLVQGNRTLIEHLARQAASVEKASQMQAATTPIAPKTLCEETPAGAANQAFRQEASQAAAAAGKPQGKTGQAVTEPGNAVEGLAGDGKEASPSDRTDPGAKAAPASDATVHDYQQAASAVLDAASLLGRVAPGTRLGRVVNLAMPAARSAVAAAPGIVEKAAPAVSQAAKAAPEMAGKAARGLGRLGDKLVQAASGAAEDLADAAKKAAEEYHRQRDE